MMPTDKGQLHIVMEFCSGGDLNRYIHSAAQEGRELHESEVMLKFVQVALALEYVHSHGVLHRVSEGHRMCTLSIGWRHYAAFV